MKVDLDYLREHYASLSDEALREVDRHELVEAARKCYDEEVARRKSGAVPHEHEEVLEPEDFALEGPDWLEDAACVCTFTAHHEGYVPDDITNAQAILDAAGMPCHVAVQKVMAEGRLLHEYGVMVPGALNLRATSLLDKELFNPRMEADWRAHFEALSDRELRAMNSETICAGLVDRAERLKRAYEDEIARRRLKVTS